MVFIQQIFVFTIKKKIVAETVETFYNKVAGDKEDDFMPTENKTGPTENSSGLLKTKLDLLKIF